MAKINGEYFNNQTTYWLGIIQAGKFVEHTTEFTELAQWFVKTLIERNIPFKVLQRGAGIKTITTQIDVCTKCNGTGRC